MGWIQIVAAPEGRDRAREFLVHLGSSAFVSRYLEALYHQPTAAVGAGVKVQPRWQELAAEIVFAPLFVYGSSLPLNGQSASLTCSDKAAAATIMEGAHIPRYTGSERARCRLSGSTRRLVPPRAPLGGFATAPDHLETGGLEYKPKTAVRAPIRSACAISSSSAAWLKLLGSGVASGEVARFCGVPVLRSRRRWRLVFLDGEIACAPAGRPARVVGDGESTPLASSQRTKDVLKTTKTGGGGRGAGRVCENWRLGSRWERRVSRGEQPL